MLNICGLIGAYVLASCGAAALSELVLCSVASGVARRDPG